MWPNHHCLVCRHPRDRDKSRVHLHPWQPSLHLFRGDREGETRQRPHLNSAASATLPFLTCSQTGARTLSQLGPAAELTAVLALPFLLFFPLLLPLPEEKQDSPSFTHCSLHRPARAIPLLTSLRNSLVLRVRLWVLTLSHHLRWITTAR